MSQKFQSPWYSLLLSKSYQHVIVHDDHIEINTKEIFPYVTQHACIPIREILFVQLIKNGMWTDAHIRCTRGESIHLNNLFHQTAFEIKCAIANKL
ncbi:MAG: hypothetical protein AABZ56_06250 [Bacteroidota bacterium]